MDLICHAPPRPLSQWVELIWHYESPPVPFALERLMPTGRVDLIINLRDEALRIYDPASLQHREQYRGPLFSGVQGTFGVIDASQQTLIMGVAFKPGGAHALLGFSVAEIRDSHLDASTIWGGEASLLREQLSDAPNAWTRIQVLEQVLWKRIERRGFMELHPAVRMALQEFEDQPGHVSIQALADESGLSSRRFIELFTRSAGVTPKLYGRILRFQETLKRIHGTRVVDWCEIAYDQGYYDQSHLIRDFQQFSGMSPTEYRALSPLHHNHVSVQ